MKLYCQLCNDPITSGHLCPACEPLTEEEIKILMASKEYLPEMRKIWAAEDKHWEELDQWRR